MFEWVPDAIVVAPRTIMWPFTPVQRGRSRVRRYWASREKTKVKTRSIDIAQTLTVIVPASLSTGGFYLCVCKQGRADTDADPHLQTSGYMCSVYL